MTIKVIKDSINDNKITMVFLAVIKQNLVNAHKKNKHITNNSVWLGSASILNRFNIYRPEGNTRKNKLDKS